MANVLLAGSSGLIGTAVKAQLDAAGHHWRALVRREPRGEREARWDPGTGFVPADAVEWADAVISLSGASLAKLPWTASYRRQIASSRVDATRAIAVAIASSSRAPNVWVSGSAVGVYGDRPGETLTEASTPGSGFLSGVVRQWEAATEPAADVTRVVLARTGFVLALGGSLGPVAATARFGLGTVFGSGRQYWPWISLVDEARALVFLATQENGGNGITGPVNLAGPQPATSEQIVRITAAQLRRPVLFRAPAWALRLALRDAADELLLADQRVAPQALVAAGFEFRHARVDDAVRAAFVRGR